MKTFNKVMVETITFLIIQLPEQSINRLAEHKIK